MTDHVEDSGTSPNRFTKYVVKVSTMLVMLTGLIFLGSGLMRLVGISALAAGDTVTPSLDIMAGLSLLYLGYRFDTQWAPTANTTSSGPASCPEPFCPRTFSGGNAETALAEHLAWDHQYSGDRAQTKARNRLENVDATGSQQNDK